MSSKEYEENMEFEKEVRRIAEAIWGLQPGECQPHHYSNDSVIQELDGMARLRDVTHLLMVTVSSRLEKIKGDVRKLNRAETYERQISNAVNKWLITKFEQNAEHITYAKTHNVTLITLDDFRRRFFDGVDYLNKRRITAFGSARNLETESITIPEDEYIDMTIKFECIYRAGKSQKLGGEINIDKIAQKLAKGENVVMVAPFGSGKSLTTREIFYNLEKSYRRSKLGIVPIVINLREHWGQLYADEILERHARSLGITPKENLVIAWRAGMCALLLDGFDEVATQAVAPVDDNLFMQKARQQALQGVRDLIENTPQGVGIFICGRDHYFDNYRELSHNLGLGNKTFTILNLTEFSEQQTLEFLTKNHLTSPLPDWLPRKPLLLGYLAHRNLLKEVYEISHDRGFGHAWDQFLDLICQREAALGRAVMDAITIRHLLERLATYVRSTSAGDGPLTSLDLSEAYKLETGQVAEGGVLMQLQRLPGLTPRTQDESFRSFVDEDMLAALQGSALARFILENKGETSKRRWLAPISNKGIAMSIYLLAKASVDVATIISTAKRVADNIRSFEPQLAADCFAIAQEMAKEDEYINCRNLVLREASLSTIDLDEIQIDDLSINDSLIEEVVYGNRGDRSNIKFKNSTIIRLNGISSLESLPIGMFSDCRIDEFDDKLTNNAVIRNPSLSPAIKALITILRKLYRQSGSGRRLQSLKKGLPPGPISNSVDEVIRILLSEKMILFSPGQSGQIVHPIRKQTSRAMYIIDAGQTAKDIIVDKVLQI